jgi:hypothetical protein
LEALRLRTASFSLCYNFGVVRHFLKTVIIFTVLIILGLAGIVIIGMLDRHEKSETYNDALLNTLGLQKE